jgi:hypothetical protein
LETAVLAASPEALRSLRALLLEEGGLLGSLVGNGGEGGSTSGGVGAESPARVAAGGPRTKSRGEQYELLVEAIYEGYLLHYGAPRILCPPEADLGLLAGDELYALGLARLVALGDLPAVAELADVITLTALAQGEGQGELALAIWSAGARAVGWGPSDSHRRAKALARAGSAQALEAMRGVAEGLSR